MAPTREECFAAIAPVLGRMVLENRARIAEEKKAERDELAEAS